MSKFQIDVRFNSTGADSNGTFGPFTRRITAEQMLPVIAARPDVLSATITPVVKPLPTNVHPTDPGDIVSPGFKGSKDAS